MIGCTVHRITRVFVEYVQPAGDDKVYLGSAPLGWTSAADAVDVSVVIVPGVRDQRVEADSVRLYRRSMTPPSLTSGASRSPRTYTSTTAARGCAHDRRASRSHSSSSSVPAAPSTELLRSMAPRVAIAQAKVSRAAGRGSHRSVHLFVRTDARMFANARRVVSSVCLMGLKPFLLRRPPPRAPATEGCCRGSPLQRSRGRTDVTGQSTTDAPSPKWFVPAPHA
jgi:hypothetical protein